MKLRVLALAFALVLGIGAGGVASASSTSPGTPGTPNCHGQTVSYIASNYGGLGELAGSGGGSVQDIQTLVNLYCSGQLGG